MLGVTSDALPLSEKRRPETNPSQSLLASCWRTSAAACCNIGEGCGAQTSAEFKSVGVSLRAVCSRETPVRPRRGIAGVPKRRRMTQEGRQHWSSATRGDIIDIRGNIVRSN